MNDGRNRIQRQAGRNGQRYIVAGPHWSWGGGYRSYAEARKALNTSQFGFGYTRCICGSWVAGLSPDEKTCAKCLQKESD